MRLGIADVAEDGRLRGKAMVVGATGAIGSVCARLLALASDELAGLPGVGQAARAEARAAAAEPRATVHIAGTPGEHLRDMDLIVTATSGAGKKVLDIMEVSPAA
ncbi:MAG: hypothetical protein R2731_07335 [Nocardioides sp.]